MTIKDAVKKSGTPVALSGASIDAAEKLLARGEKVLHAVVAVCSVDDNRASGTLVVTSHRILFCTSTLGKVWSRYILLGDCVGLGDITGKLISKLKISSDSTAIIVELSRDHLTALQTAILDAVASYPNQSPIDFTPAPDPAPAPVSSVDPTIKICRTCGDRLLAGARKCPTCGSKNLVELDRDDAAGIAAVRAQAGQAPRTSAAPTVTDIAAVRAQAGQDPRTSAASAPASRPLTKRGQARQRKKDNKAAGVACCPKCGSTSLFGHKKGFGAGKAAAGMFLTGGLAGAVAGGIGANKVEVTCLYCGHKFRP